MANIGIFSLPWSGHLNPLASLAQELSSRGHQVSFWHVPEFAPRIEALGCRFQAYAEGVFPASYFAQRQHRLSELTGEAAFETALGISQELCGVLLQHGEDALRKHPLDLLLIDQLDYGAATLASRLELPFVTVAVCLLRNPEAGVPGYDGKVEEEIADGSTEKPPPSTLSRLVRPYLEALDAYRATHGMPPFSYDEIWSQLAQISQQPEGFEFPRNSLPGCFHFTGPFARAGDRRTVPFPWERLNGKPLLYASLGTAQQRQRPLYQSILEAVQGLDLQLVLSLGGAAEIELPGSPVDAVVVPTAPQLEVLERASLMITHAGMNSTLECLTAGVPMVALPISHDQPGVAARIAWSQTGLVIPAQECTALGLRQAVERVLTEENFRAKAREFQASIAAFNGRSRAAEIIEDVLRTGCPVLRSRPSRA